MSWVLPPPLLHPSMSIFALLPSHVGTCGVNLVMPPPSLAHNEDLGVRDQYRFKQPNPNLNNSTETNSDPARSGITASPSTNKKKTNVMHKNCMPSVFRFGLSTKVTKTKAENIRERDEREALRKKQKLDNCIINIDDDDIDFGGLGVGGDTVEDGYNVTLLALSPSDYRIT